MRCCPCDGKVVLLLLFMFFVLLVSGDGTGSFRKYSECAVNSPNITNVTLKFSCVPELLKHLRIWKQFYFLLLFAFCLFVVKDWLTLKHHRDYKIKYKKPHQHYLKLCSTWIRIVYGWSATRLHLTIGRLLFFLQWLVLFSHRGHRCDLHSARGSQPVCGFSCQSASGAHAHPLCRVWND